MPEHQQPQTFRELETQLADWKSQRDRLDALISAREELMSALKKEAALGISTLFVMDSHGSANGGDPQPDKQPQPTAQEKPDTGEAAIRVLNGTGRPMTKQAIFHELVRRGWAPVGKNPPAAVGSALYYLSKQGLVEKHGEGRDITWGLKEGTTIPAESFALEIKAEP